VACISQTAQDTIRVAIAIDHYLEGSYVLTITTKPMTLDDLERKFPLLHYKCVKCV